MDSQKWPQRGNKLFLPKIEYNRLENTNDFQWNTTKSRIDTDELIVPKDMENSELERSTSPMADQGNGRTYGSFKTFSVLPPIQDKRSSKGRSRGDKTLKLDPILKEQDIYMRRRGSFLHRQTALVAGDREAITLQKTNTDNLKIVGKRYSGLNNNRKGHQQTVSAEEQIRIRSGNDSSRRPSTTPDFSHPLVFGEKSRPLSDSENDSGLMPYPGILKYRSGALQNGRRFSKFRRFNSDTSNERKEENSGAFNRSKNSNSLSIAPSSYPKANLLLNPFENTEVVNEISGYVSNCRTPRPISRCHIDINMNEAENTSLNLMDNRKVSAETNLLNESIYQETSSSPLIQITTEENSRFEGPRESQNSPSIQVLINSLDSAKEEIQDEKMELKPQTSVREQRRRSALCRANSKQVDDFLLVHNLRDLGLL